MGVGGFGGFSESAGIVQLPDIGHYQAVGLKARAIHFRELPLHYVGLVKENPSTPKRHQKNPDLQQNRSSFIQSQFGPLLRSIYFFIGGCVSYGLGVYGLFLLCTRNKRGGLLI